MKTTMRTKVSIGMMIIGTAIFIGGIQLGKIGDRIPRIPAEQVAPAHDEWRTGPFGPHIETVGGDDTPGNAKMCYIGAILLSTFGGLFATAGVVDIIKSIKNY
jgi:hypothetical protein